MPMPLLLLPVLLLCQASALSMPVEQARHLALRTGFGPTPAAVRRLSFLRYADAVDQLLAPIDSAAMTTPPAFLSQTVPDWKALAGMSTPEKKSFRRQRRENGEALKVWWYREMIATRQPFVERMTLFWHGHFTSSLRKVKTPSLLYRQNTLFRRHALGSYRDLLRRVARDPAMLIYLDNQSNRKGSPNENFARELLELFTLGEGHYTERDVKEAARAFTGRKADYRNGRFTFVKRLHDPGDKTFLGHRGRFGGDEIIDILLQHPRTAEHLVGKLWIEFISPSPEPDQVRQWAGLLRDSDYQLKPLLRAMLTSDAFRSSANRGILVKSPVELVVGIHRLLNTDVVDGGAVLRSARQLGQDILDPPNVKGWPTGNDWITSASLPARIGLIERATRGWEMQPPAMGNAAAVDPLAAMTRDLDITELQSMLLAAPPLEPPEPSDTLVEQLRSLLLDPVWQLK